MDFVKANLASSAHRQSNQFNTNSRDRLFEVGNQVWLSVPTNGKLQPRWEGGWIVKSKKSVVNYEVTDGKRKRVVHINCLKHMWMNTNCSNQVHHGVHRQLTTQSLLKKYYLQSDDIQKGPHSFWTIISGRQ